MWKTWRTCICKDDICLPRLFSLKTLWVLYSPVPSTLTAVAHLCHSCPDGNNFLCRYFPWVQSLPPWHCCSYQSYNVAAREIGLYVHAWELSGGGYTAMTMNDMLKTSFSIATHPLLADQLDRTKRFGDHTVIFISEYKNMSILQCCSKRNRTLCTWSL